MARLGPWGRSRRVAVAVSGGADSLCLAVLAKAWGNPVALVVDHRLRPDSTAEAELTEARLAGLGIPSLLLTLSGLSAGPGLAARARDARYAALIQAAGSLRLSDLLVGHHAGDQAETVLMRQQAGSGVAGCAGMQPITIRRDVRLVRPLLASSPDRLRATLRQAGVDWVEDPSNHDLAALRPRLRAALQDEGRARLLAEAAAEAAQARSAKDSLVAAELAGRVTLFAEGCALLTPGPIAPESLGALIRTLGGSLHAAATAALARLARAPAPATLGGVRLMPAGRLGPGLLLLREAACIGPDVPASAGALWDGRFRVTQAQCVPAGAVIGGLRRQAARVRSHSQWPAAVLETLPALWLEGRIGAVPHLGYTAGWTNSRLGLTFEPPEPACGAPWMGDAQPPGYSHVPYTAQVSGRSTADFRDVTRLSDGALD